MYHYDGRSNYDPYRQYHVPQASIMDEINKYGRIGHCYMSSWGGREHTFILMGIDAAGMVSIVENGTPSSVHHTDMVGLTYLGVQCPVSPGPGGPGGGPGPWTPPCTWQWVWIPGQGWRWVCK
jgi:hypothetical protein